MKYIVMKSYPPQDRFLHTHKLLWSNEKGLFMGEFFDEEGELNWSWSIDELKLVYFDHPCIQG